MRGADLGLILLVSCSYKRTAHKTKKTYHKPVSAIIDAIDASYRIPRFPLTIRAWFDRTRSRPVPTALKQPLQTRT